MSASASIPRTRPTTSRTTAGTSTPQSARKIADMTGAKAYFMGGEQTGKFLERMSGK